MSLPDSSESAVRLSETVTMPHFTDAGAFSLCFAGTDIEEMRREDRRRSKAWPSELTLNKVEAVRAFGANSRMAHRYSEQFSPAQPGRILSLLSPVPP